jgi:hypothetical protein
MLPTTTHVHVHTVALDLTPMQQPSTPMNWPAELRALAQNEDRTAAVAALQASLQGCANAHPIVDTRLVRSRALVWRNGGRVPASSSFEHTRVTIPLVSVLKSSAEVADVFGRFLADSGRYQGSFLLACVQEAGLGEQKAMLARLPHEQRAAALDALCGHISPDSVQDVIIALP